MSKALFFQTEYFTMKIRHAQRKLQTRISWHKAMKSISIFELPLDGWYNTCLLNLLKVSQLKLHQPLGV